MRAGRGGHDETLGAISFILCERGGSESRFQDALRMLSDFSGVPLPNMREGSPVSFSTQSQVRQSTPAPGQGRGFYVPENQSRSNDSSPSTPNHLEGTGMHFSRSIKTQTVGAKNNPYSSDRDGDVILIHDWARTKSAKVGADIAGMTPSGFKKVQAGEATLSYEKLMHAMRNDPELRAALFVRAGGHLEVNPAQVAAISRAFNSIVRGDYSE